VKIKRKLYFYGWLVLFVPMSLVVGLQFLYLEELPWVKNQSSRGAQAEALTANSLGLIAMNNGSFQEAYGQFKFAIKTKPDYAEPIMNLGILSHKMGNENLAIQYLWQAIDKNPRKRDMIYNNLGLVYAARAEYDTAKAMFHKALDLGLRPAPIWKNIGQVEEAQGNIPSAIKAYSNSVESRPTLMNMYVEILQEALYSQENDDYSGKVRAQLDNGIKDEDLAPYDSVIVNLFLSRNIKVAESYKDLAIAFEMNGQIDEAIYNFREALEIKPDWSAIQNRIGIIFAKGENYQAAKREFEGALMSNPHNQEAIRNLEMVNERIQKKL
jgi:tetratricopeptide (TPR) repeat protein